MHSLNSTFKVNVYPWSKTMECPLLQNTVSLWQSMWQQQQAAKKEDSVPGTPGGSLRLLPVSCTCREKFSLTVCGERLCSEDDYTNSSVRWQWTLVSKWSGKCELKPEEVAPHPCYNGYYQKQTAWTGEVIEQKGIPCTVTRKANWRVHYG